MASILGLRGVVRSPIAAIYCNHPLEPKGDKGGAVNSYLIAILHLLRMLHYNGNKNQASDVQDSYIVKSEAAVVSHRTVTPRVPL